MSHPDPHAFIRHLQDRLASVAADALRLAQAHKHALPSAFGDGIAIANHALADWEQDTRQARAELEYPGAIPVGGKR